MKTMFKRVMKLTSFFTFLMIVAAPSAFASEQNPPDFVSDGERLAKDALNWILILVPVTCATWLGYHAWMKSMADGDPGAIAERNKKMKNVLIGSIIAEGAAGIVRSVLGYFS